MLQLQAFSSTHIFLTSWLQQNHIKDTTSMKLRLFSCPQSLHQLSKGISISDLKIN
jgi:hypothetical protein